MTPATPADPRAGQETRMDVKCRPLPWDDVGHDDWTLRAKALGLEYEIEFSKAETYEVYSDADDMDPLAECWTEHEAQAAAQADFERRVGFWLAQAPSPEEPSRG